LYRLPILYENVAFLPYFVYNKIEDNERSDFMPTRLEIEKSIKILLVRYNAESALLFGSYARGEETAESDVDVIVFGGKNFKKSNIFAFAEELRQMINKDVDAFEICEVNQNTPFYDNIMKEGIKIA
jgi:predicted nucleotidyltransferase